MTRTVMIVGLLAMLLVTLGGPALSIAPAGAAEMMESDKAMMKATGEDLKALKNDLAAIWIKQSAITARAFPTPSGKPDSPQVFVAKKLCQCIRRRGPEVRPALCPTNSP